MVVTFCCKNGAMEGLRSGYYVADLALERQAGYNATCTSSVVCLSWPQAA